MIFNNEVEDNLDDENTIDTSNNSSNENVTTNNINNMRDFDCIIHQLSTCNSNKNSHKEADS